MWTAWILASGKMLYAKWVFSCAVGCVTEAFSVESVPKLLLSDKESGKVVAMATTPSTCAQHCNSIETSVSDLYTIFTTYTLTHSVCWTVTTEMSQVVSNLSNQIAALCLSKEPTLSVYDLLKLLSLTDLIIRCNLVPGSWAINGRFVHGIGHWCKTVYPGELSLSISLPKTVSNTRYTQFNVPQNNVTCHNCKLHGGCNYTASRLRTRIC